MRVAVKTLFIFDRVASVSIRTCVREAYDKPFLVDRLGFWFNKV